MADVGSISSEASLLDAVATFCFAGWDVEGGHQRNFMVG